MGSNKSILSPVIPLIIGFSFVLIATNSSPSSYQNEFDPLRAATDIQNQLAFGPRIPYSDAHRKTRVYIKTEMQKSGWVVVKQKGEILGYAVHNILSCWNSGYPPRLLLGAHYDSRIWADRDPVAANRTEPVPGANDGASGVAVLLELGRTIPEEYREQICMVFFDAEDQGNIPGWEWIMGSRVFAREMKWTPKSVLIIDMVGDTQLSLPREVHSDQYLVDVIWSQADSNGYSKYFKQKQGKQILDDHVPFLERNIPAAVIIDLDYPYWHTTEDTFDKIDPNSLKVVGDTILSSLSLLLEFE
jgi:hypothetical protein